MTNRLVALVFPVFVAFLLQAQAPSDSYRPPAIRRMIFEDAWQLSASERMEIKNRILEEYAQAEFGERSTIGGLADEAAERVRAAYTSRGYFKVDVTASVEPVGNYPVTRSVDIVITVLSSGTQYRLSAIRFTHATLFPQNRLLGLMPVQAGQIFDLSKIVQGLGTVQKLYSSAGYLDFTSIPNIVPDERRATVSLDIDTDEGKQFRWGDLIIIGRDDEHTQAMLDGWRLMRGKVYSPNELRQFFSKFFHTIPADADPSRYTEKRGYHPDCTVDVVLKFVEPIFEAKN